MRIWWHKVTHWEYWPVYVVYAPTFLFWIINVIKFRSLTFFRHANPCMANGGLYGDRKSEMYHLLPPDLYPITILVRAGEHSNLKSIISAHGLDFPLIAKPDIGHRGINVSKVENIEELENYAQSVREDFLIQEVVTYAQEIGLFYYRLPDESSGNISGITIKNFLTVQGNGKDSLMQLLSSIPRHTMQIPPLSQKYDLNKVLDMGVRKCLVPFGNHNRGTEFLDGSNRISDQLHHSLDPILSNIQGFYYGRLDIRFDDWEALESGKNFKIIEINGAKSEPTHIYDPAHSFWHGQREIFRHQVLFQRIVAKNIKRKNLT